MRCALRQSSWQPEVRSVGIRNGVVGRRRPISTVDFVERQGSDTVDQVHVGVVRQGG